MTLRITYDDNQTSHDDITLQLGDYLTTIDSYYFLLNRDESGGTRSVLAELSELFDRWLELIDSPATECYLLIDLQDQATRWLQCLWSGDQVTVTLGWSPVEGYTIQLPDEVARLSAPIEFATIETAQPLSMRTSQLRRAVEDSQRMLNGQLQAVIDPTPIFHHFRGAYATQLLTAAVAHFNLFGRVADGITEISTLRDQLKLAERPFTVLTTALKAMELLTQHGDQLALTPLAAEHLQDGTPFDVSNYIGLAAQSPDVLEMVERLRTNTPIGADSAETGTAFIYKAGTRSSMDHQELARHFTISLAGRARNVAPVLAAQHRLHDARTLLDVGGGSGIYSVAYLVRNPRLKAIVLDRSEVLPVAKEFAEEFGVSDRLELIPGDMFHDEFPPADTILLSNILHDWDMAECQQLVKKCATALPENGQLLIHDVFLNDALDGPLDLALYSAALFTLTEGRAYSVLEYKTWLESAGLEVSGPQPTLVHCGVLVGKKS